MHAAQRVVNLEWEKEGRAPFGIGIGLSTGSVAAALLGSEERVEYTLVGDAVNLCQRLQQFAEPGQTVLSEPTWDALTVRPDDAEKLEPQLVKGRDTPVVAYRRGSMPEVVDEGVTGYLAHDVESSVGAVRAAVCLDRAAVHARAVARFGASRMVDDYLRLYEALLMSASTAPSGA